MLVHCVLLGIFMLSRCRGAVLTSCAAVPCLPAGTAGGSAATCSCRKVGAGGKLHGRAAAGTLPLLCLHWGRPGPGSRPFLRAKWCESSRQKLLPLHTPHDLLQFLLGCRRRVVSPPGPPTIVSLSTLDPFSVPACSTVGPARDSAGCGLLTVKLQPPAQNGGAGGSGWPQVQRPTAAECCCLHSLSPPVPPARKTPAAPLSPLLCNPAALSSYSVVCVPQRCNILVRRGRRQLAATAEVSPPCNPAHMMRASGPGSKLKGSSSVSV